MRKVGDELTVYYHPKEQVLVGVVMAGFAAMFGLATFVTALDLPDSSAALVTPIVGVIAFVLGLLAIASFVVGWHRRKKPVWLMRFTPQTVHLNPVHPGYWHHLRPQDTMSMTLPVETMDWIRRATKPRRTSEDVDEEFVEIRVDDETFHSALENRSDLTNQMRNGNAYEMFAKRSSACSREMCSGYLLKADDGQRVLRLFAPATHTQWSLPLRSRSRSI